MFDHLSYLSPNLEGGCDDKLAWLDLKVKFLACTEQLHAMGFTMPIGQFGQLVRNFLRFSLYSPSSWEPSPYPSQSQIPFLDDPNLIPGDLNPNN
jgi:hypothetical protein